MADGKLLAVARRFPMTDKTDAKTVLETLNRLVDGDGGLRSDGAIIPTEHLNTWEEIVIAARDALAASEARVEALERWQQRAIQLEPRLEWLDLAAEITPADVAAPRRRRGSEA
jgi:hypothetical protein